MRFLFKLFLSFLLAFLFILVSFLFYALVKCKTKRYKFSSFLTHLFSKLALRILGIKLFIKGKQKLDPNKNYFVLSNHLSYIDIFLISSFLKSLFVSTHEVKEMFLVGKIALYGGSVFIKRRNKSSIKQDRDNIKFVLERDFNLVLFPEGTTGNGETVLPFKSTLILENEPINVAIICINYLEVNGEPVDIYARDKVFYYGDMKFSNHFFELLKLRSIKAEIDIVDVLENKAFNRKELMNKSYFLIQKTFRPLKVS